jgi:arginine decarboxylase
MHSLVPSKVFFVKGAGRHADRLNSFEEALRDAGIQMFNLVTVSSIIPHRCEIVPAPKGLKFLEPGEIVFCVMARTSTNKAVPISASIGCALPKDRNSYGYLSEYHSAGDSGKNAGDYAEGLAASMLASALGKKSPKIARKTNFTQTAMGKEGVWTTVVSAAVFVLPDGIAKRKE